MSEPASRCADPWWRPRRALPALQLRQRFADLAIVVLERNAHPVQAASAQVDAESARSRSVRTISPRPGCSKVISTTCISASSASGFSGARVARISKLSPSWGQLGDADAESGKSIAASPEKPSWRVRRANAESISAITASCARSISAPTMYGIRCGRACTARPEPQRARSRLTPWPRRPAQAQARSD